MQGYDQWSDDTLRDTAEIIEPQQNLAKPVKQNDDLPGTQELFSSGLETTRH